jgi:hypothetical protein
VNKHQRVVLGIGLLLVVLCGLFPPFEAGYGHGQMYRFIFVVTDNSKIVFSRFFVEVVTIIAATAGAFLLFGIQSNKTNAQDKTDIATPRSSWDDKVVMPTLTPEGVMRVKISKKFDKQLRDSVSSFVSRDFGQSEEAVRERAVRYIYGKLHFAAQYHLAEHKTTDGFNIASQIEKLAMRFRQLRRTGGKEGLNEPPEYPRWPGDWPGRKMVDLDRVGDPGEWLSCQIPSEEEVLTQHPEHDEDTAINLADAYIGTCEELGLQLPSDFWGSKENMRVAAIIDFIGFIREWRRRAIIAECLKPMK